MKKLVIPYNVTAIYNIGLPFDDQDDEISVEGWGYVTPLEEDEKPNWILFDNVNIGTGLKFEMSPPLSELGNKYLMYVDLKDKHPKEPIEIRYEF